MKPILDLFIVIYCFQEFRESKYDQQKQYLHNSIFKYLVLKARTVLMSYHLNIKQVYDEAALSKEEAIRFLIFYALGNLSLSLINLKVECRKNEIL